MHTPDQQKRDLVQRLSSVGVRYDDIALKLDICDDTLKKYYKKELDHGRIDANAIVAGTLYGLAKSGNIAATIFWLKTRAKWRETDVDQNGEKVIRRYGGIPTEDG